ncbi:hypothetical protein CRYUN_Cryun13aG0139600 [Craigia yunnanensis]
MESGISSSDNKMVATNQRKGFEGIRLENPFTLKVGQVFTGFGIGCGIGIGVGRPINIGAIPMLGQVMSATRGATDAFSGVSRHVNGALRKLGAKNIEAGIGCGVGLGHGFGVGLAVKPGVVHQIQCCVIQAMTKLMLKFGMAPNLPFSEARGFPESFQSGLTATNEPSIQSSLGNMKQMLSKLPDPTSQSLHGPGNMSRGSAYEKISSKSPTESSYGSRTEKVLNSFLQNPVLKEDEISLNELAGRLRSENNMLQLVLKHQRIIEELMEENQKLHQILMEDLKIPPSKLQASYSNHSTAIPKFLFDNLSNRILSSGEVFQTDSAEVLLTIISYDPKEEDTKSATPPSNASKDKLYSRIEAAKFGEDITGGVAIDGEGGELIGGVGEDITGGVAIDGEGAIGEGGELIGEGAIGVDEGLGAVGVDEGLGAIGVVDGLGVVGLVGVMEGGLDMVGGGEEVGVTAGGGVMVVGGGVDAVGGVPPVDGVLLELGGIFGGADGL